ncbi:PGTB1 [Lepeophtheirus salmonis]|uniref:PGTB1 n=2 Tax=Lepeophtheirus salmonis TaxID=72036 RepID=A0A7R8D3X9_LEPSM|nr:PGTB1 [Lepeophtheirus salmonis]CAF3021089.1 PGTB1 [Lepeophtheirus salmonis]
MEERQLLRSRHVKFLRRILETPNPSSSSSMDSSRMTIVFFCVAGLDLLGEKKLDEMNEWIWSCLSSKGFNGNPGRTQGPGHIAMTYSALNILLILQDSLKQLDKKTL